MGIYLCRESTAAHLRHNFNKYFIEVHMLICDISPRIVDF
jgi:hypothetical protein